MSSGVTVLHFWSPTCGPCQTIKPAIETMKEDFDTVQWVSVNTHKDLGGYTAQFKVTTVPTLVFLKHNAEIGRHVGANMSMFYTLLRKALSA